MKITTILQTWKRPQYLAEQIKAIRSQTVKSDKIIIVQNEGNVVFDYPDDVEVIKSTTNKKYHFRFAVGLLEDCDYLAFFDDDTIPGLRWYENCINTIEKHDCICVTNGRIVDIKNMRQYGPGWSSPSDNEVLCDFGGHSWVLRQKNLKYMWFDDILEYNNGEDIQLSINAKRFANIPTYAPPHPANNKSLWGSDPVKAMKYGCDSVSSWIVRKDVHNNERFNLFNKYIERGWKPVLD